MNDHEDIMDQVKKTFDDLFRAGLNMKDACHMAYETEKEAGRKAVN